MADTEWDVLILFENGSNKRLILTPRVYPFRDLDTVADVISLIQPEVSAPSTEKVVITRTRRIL